MRTVAVLLGWSWPSRVIQIFNQISGLLAKQNFLGWSALQRRATIMDKYAQLRLTHPALHSDLRDFQVNCGCQRLGIALPFWKYYHTETTSAGWHNGRGHWPRGQAPHSELSVFVIVFIFVFAEKVWNSIELNIELNHFLAKFKYWIESIWVSFTTRLRRILHFFWERADLLNFSNRYPLTYLETLSGGRHCGCW